MSIRPVAVLVLMFATGCPQSSSIDPETTADAAVDAAIDAPIRRSAHVLYLNVEGGQVTPAATDDATMNKSAIVSGIRTFAPFANGAADRGAQIAALHDAMIVSLAPYDVDIVETRPATGPYQMVIVTDDLPTKFGFPASNFGIAPTACTPAGTKPSSIAFVFATTLPNRYNIAQTATFTLGVMAAIPVTTVHNDCMYDDLAGPMTAPCTIGGPGTMVHTEAYVNICTGIPATIDEAALFLSTFGPRP